MKPVKFMCPECYEIVDVRKVNNVIDFEYYDLPDFMTDFHLGEDVENVSYNVDLPLINIHCTCKHCNNKVSLIELDEGIVDMISNLNKKGYDTIFSCEGHIINEENYDLAYVIFEVPDIADDIFFINRIYKNFPSHAWIINRSFRRLENKSVVEIYMRDSYAKEDKKRLEALRFLNEFVNVIPNINEIMEG